MAAEKLTKARLIQILFLMTVLITAFIWRTISYKDTTETTHDTVVCLLSAGSCKIEGQEQGELLTISLTPYPVKADTELVLHIGNTNVKPVATVEDIEMNMRAIPVPFEQQGNNWLGKFSVPGGGGEKMPWRITIKSGEQDIIAKFMVEK